MPYVAVVLGTLALLTMPAVAQTIDGSGCFKVKDTAPKATYTVLFAGQSCRIKTPAKLACLTERNAPVSPAPPASSTVAAAPTLLCYRARCQPKTVRPAILADAFGSRSVTLRAGQFLCLPAGGEDTITTTTTLPGGVTTTTIAQAACGFDDGQCGGGCPGTQRCSIAEGECKCRTTECGDADAPSCNGSCPNSDEACLFVLTGCKCVEVP
ncbi:MAG TPA: hypothetical protein VGR62_01225 [Candidatus Binatia bacterium]|jgi:hypothetical protein|nr:hypothetical protein [Candidatus Binatia bacterium]